MHTCGHKIVIKMCENEQNVRYVGNWNNILLIKPHPRAAAVATLCFVLVTYSHSRLVNKRENFIKSDKRYFRVCSRPSIMTMYFDFKVNLKPGAFLVSVEWHQQLPLLAVGSCTTEPLTCTHVNVFNHMVMTINLLCRPMSTIVYWN